MEKPPAKIIAFRADPELRAAIERAAAKDQRTVSQWIVVTLRRALGKKGKRDGG